jgi:hypothetical protein
LFNKQCQQFQIQDSIGKIYTLPFHGGYSIMLYKNSTGIMNEPTKQPHLMFPKYYEL